MNNNAILLPEWANQSAIQLTWPHEGTDWREYLDDICATYAEMADAITRYEKLLVVAPEPESLKKELSKRLTRLSVGTI